MNRKRIIFSKKRHVPVIFSGHARKIEIPDRTSYIICRAQGKMKMWGPLFKNHEEFQDSYSRALNQAHGPPNHGTMSNLVQVVPPRKVVLIPVTVFTKPCQSYSYQDQN